MNQLSTSTSRVLAALLFVAVTTESAAQSFPLPYNPDENGDMLIGVVDLQALLANYGQEFSGAVLSEDGESAITYMGDMAYPLCAQTCRNLPGMWGIPDIEDLGLVWEDIISSSTSTWVDEYDRFQNTLATAIDEITPVAVYLSTSTFSGLRASSLGTPEYRCYCAARQLPRVEFYKCVGNGSDAVEQCVTCTNTKLAEGWQLLPPGGSSTVQDLWRWAE